MFSFLTDLEINVIVAVVSAGLAYGFKTKISDLIAGVPSDLRTALNDVEADAKAKLAAAKAPVVKKAASPAAAIVAASAASVAAAPVAASPAVAAVAAAAAAAPAPAPLTPPVA